MQGPEKNSYKEFDNEKKIPAARKSPPPLPHNFSNGPSLIKDSWALNVFICYFRFLSHLSNILYERVSAKRGSTVGL